jgi:hypothetical protein
MLLAWPSPACGSGEIGPAGQEAVMDRLNPLDALFVDAEDADPHTSMAIASIAVFEGPAPSHEEFLAHLAGRLPRVPRYRQKLRTVPLRLGRPVWVDDPDFDLGYHVRRTALPAPGGDAQLAALMGRVMSQRLDRDHPLWEYWLAEGLNGGRWALISKVHHCMVDGVSGTDLYRVIFDFSPESSPPATDDRAVSAEPSPLQLAAEAALDVVVLPVREAAMASFGVISACYTNIAISVSFQRDTGVLKRTNGTPLPSSAFLGARMIQALFVAILLVVITAGFGRAAYSASIPAGPSLLRFLVMLLVGAASFCALGFAITAAIPNADAAPAIVNASILPLLFLSGVFIPLGANAPAWIVWIAEIFPVWHFALGMQAGFLGTAFHWADVLVVAVWGLAGLLLSVRYFSWEPRT